MDELEEETLEFIERFAADAWELGAEPFGIWHCGMYWSGRAPNREHGVIELTIVSNTTSKTIELSEQIRKGILRAFGRHYDAYCKERRWKND
jgi:hypothetical protein